MIGEPRETRTLPNGLVLRMYDDSRVAAGDRRLVVFRAVIEAAVDPENMTPSGPDDPDCEKVRKLLGRTAKFEYEKKRHFVDQALKDQVWLELRDDFLESGLSYVSGPDFARRLILRRFREASGAVPRWGSKRA